MKVAIIAPPWLSIPVNGYGGIELVVEGLVKELVELGIEVEIFGNGAHTMPGIKTHYLYKTEQFKDIARPLFDSLPILNAHMQFALNEIKKDGSFDVIHDHNGFLGPLLLAWATCDKDIPPVIHTNHGPPFSDNDTLKQGLPDNRPFWRQLAINAGRLYVVGISNALMKSSPPELSGHILPTVYNAVDMKKYPFIYNKKDYFITLARFTVEKGQHVAARICADNGYKLKMAGIVSGIGSNEELMKELKAPDSIFRSEDGFRYFFDEIYPYIGDNIEYVGNLSGGNKYDFISNAKALLFPIDWEEPFGMAAIESLACGTPVVAMNRGAMSEIINHGVNGFLANDEDEFEEYMSIVDKIDPNVCRSSVMDKFSSKVMALEYINRYKQVIDLTK